MPSTDASSASVQAVGNYVLTVIGESLVDIISNPRRPEEIQTHPGGSPLNVAVGAARLDLQTTLLRPGDKATLALVKAARRPSLATIYCPRPWLSAPAQSVTVPDRKRNGHRKMAT
ncbi:hypothetical protein [Arthrobacter oryzae]|uniref:hypothetical protein n=1 Tax=Arthrobacter oryzae TaxID=409290 RepID=UPI0027840754|nr:sugar/nucleoside kinase (ribokinase family) [Arthrobacter oryzae]